MEGRKYKNSRPRRADKRRKPDRGRRAGRMGHKKKVCRKARTRAKIAVVTAFTFVLLLAVKEEFLSDKFSIHLHSKGDGAEQPADIELQGLYSPYAALTSLSDGELIAEHNSQERMYPASLTKIMTAILAVENTDNLEETITMPAAIFNDLYVEGASMAGFEPGEEVKLKDLLYGVLLPSGAECCVTFAEKIAGSEEAFAGKMNQKAEELGMVHTHFCNSTGLQDKEHYSTAGDIAILLKYALQNDIFRAVFVSESYSTEPTEQHPEGITFHSTMFKELESARIPGGTILGGKTGYTEEAGLCLASLAEINGKEYILVTAGAKGSHDTKPFHVMDAVEVYGEVAVSLQSVHFTVQDRREMTRCVEQVKAGDFSI